MSLVLFFSHFLSISFVNLVLNLWDLPASPTNSCKFHKFNTKVLYFLYEKYKKIIKTKHFSKKNYISTNTNNYILILRSLGAFILFYLLIFFNEYSGVETLRA